MTHRRRAFSLAELVLAVGILAGSLLLVVGIFATLITGSQKAADLTVGSVVADGILSEHVYQLMASSTVRTRFFQATYATPQVLRGGSHVLNNNVFFYKLYCQDIQLTDSLHCAATDGSAGQTSLKRLDIVVWWQDSEAASGSSASAMRITNPSRAGVGTLQVHQARVLWPTGSQ